MKKKELIDALEKLNKEQLLFYNSPEFKKYRKDEQIKSLLNSRSYSAILDFYKERINTKINKYRNIIFHRNKKEDILCEDYEEEKIPSKELKKIETAKKVVYTCVVGNYDKVEEPILLTDNTDYILFTDNIKKYKRLEGWKVELIPKRLRKKYPNPTLLNRYIKMHPNLFFSDYDYAIYIDGNIKVVSDLNEIFAKSKCKSGIAMHLHGKRNDAYEEALYCIKRKKGNIYKILDLIKKYKKEEFPRYYGLFEACIISFDLKNPMSIKIMKEWWEEFTNTETNRDQLSFSYILWKNKLLPEEMGILGNDVSTNVKFRKKQHINFT